MRKKQHGESMVSVTKARSGSFKNFRNAWPEIGSLTEVLPNECLDLIDVPVRQVLEAPFVVEQGFVGGGCRPWYG